MATDSEPLRTLRYDGTASNSIRLVAEDGTQYLVEVTDELRGAVRRLGALAQKLAQELDSDLRPRDIQALIRSGIGPEELAQAAGIDPEVVWRYAGPVVDERAWIADQAQEVPVSHDHDAPLLGELALDRLATRGVSPDSMTWDALRDHGRWIVALAYSSGDGDAEARWAVDLTHRTLEALDEEAAWISETLMPDGPIRFDAHRTLAAIDGGASEAEPTGEGGVSGQTSDLSPSLALLDDLMSSRGLRQPVDVPADGPGMEAPSPLVRGDDDGAADGDSAPVADILHLLPPLETQDTSAPLYSQMTRANTGADRDDATRAPGPDGAGAGSPSRRSILDRRHEVEDGDQKTTRPPASPLEEDASVGVEPAPASDDPSSAQDRRGRRRQTRRPNHEETDAPPPADTVPADGPSSPSNPPSPPASDGAPKVADASKVEQAGPSAPRPPSTRTPTPTRRKPPSDATEVVSLAPLDGSDPPDSPEPPVRRGTKPATESKARPRSRRSSVPSWDEIVFGAKPEA